MKLPYALTALALLALANSPLRAATMTASPAAPVIDGEDIANYGEPSSSDKWWVGTDGTSAAKGQGFTTGGAAVCLKSITYQIATNATPTKTYAIRVGKLAGPAFTLVHSETVTQSFTWNAGDFVTWTFASPVILDPYTTYGIDVGMLTSTSDWRTGLPYINLTGDDYSGGMSYSSGASGTGNATVSYAISSDRVFHLDIERPLGPVFELVAKSPADDSTDALASRELVLTFSQNVAPGSGSLTVRNLTDGTDTTLAPNDSRLTYDQNVVRINPAGLLGWSKNHAIRLDAGGFLGDGGAPVAAITDDTTWNFTTAASDPLLDAIAALKNHITGAITLTGPQIAAHKATIDATKSRFDESSATMSAVFDLVKTYDSTKGPLFVSGSTVTGFSRTNTSSTSTTSISSENIHWVVYSVMQSIMDVIYDADTLADPVKRAVIAGYNNPGGFKFGSHTDFPGPCSPPSNPSNSHTVAINGSFPKTFGRDTQCWTWPARKPTGTYLAPGTIATVTVPPALVNAGYKVRVGAQSWDLSGRTPVERLERATRLYPLDATTIEVASPYGGGIYIEVPIGSNAGVVSVTITGAVRSPYFSAKSFHQTTASQWDTEKTHTAPWADFQSDKFMIQVPRKWIYNMTGDQAVQLMVDWDKAMDAINSLMGFPLNRGKETMYCQTDVILRSSVHAPGYPAINVSSNVNSEVSPAGYCNNYLVRGPGASPTAAEIEFHEQGHAYGFPKFGGESESNVNLLQPAMLHRKFGYSIDVAHAGSCGYSSVHRSLDNTAVAWMCCFSFSPNEIPMFELEKQYQLKGHAKFMDIARLFGWDGLDTYWRSFQEDDAAGISYANTNDDKLLRLSRSVGKDLRPLFHFWGVPPENPSTLAAAIAAANIPASPEIRDLLLRYKTLVPANNADFQTFCLNWWGKKPSVAGLWEETDHAMQWDETLDADNPAWASVRPTITTGSKYVEGCAAEIRARVDELVELYFPLGMTPITMGFATAPTVLNASTITMTATTVTAASPPVQYYFENTTNATNSGWINTPTWQQTGLTPGSYSYRVKARNSVNTENDWSPVSTVSLTSAGDVSPPSPSPMTFASPPAAEDSETITMTATVATDANSVEYDFANTTRGTNSGWQDSPAYTETGLDPGTSYTYSVRARDKSPAQNTTAASAPASATTAVPDTTPPSPDPMSFAVLPNALGQTSITMTATTATDPGGVEYFFECSAGGGPDSGWQSAAVFTPTGLVPSTTYTYTVRARDAEFNETVPSTPASATTDAPDTTAPTPNPMTFASPPAALGQTSITMTATTATDPSGVEYFFECAAGGGHSSAWQDSPTYTDTGLTSGTQYTYRVRARDKSAAQTATAWSATASATTSVPGAVAVFTGANKTNGDNWNVATNWTPSGIPTGSVNVSIPASKQVTAQSSTTPTYSGSSLSIGSNALLQIGYNSNLPESYRALGTPGTTTISMAAGSQLAVSRISGTYTIPAIQLDGNAIIRTGESTNTAPTLNFNHAISGAYTVTFQGKSDSKVNLNAANGFSALVADWTGYTNSEMTITAAAAGSLGNGDVTIKPFTDGKSCALLVISAANAMADTATLTLNGSSANKLTMNANDTIGKLVVNGARQPAGTYGKVGQSGVDYQVTWIKSTSTGILTVAGPSSNYWDKNGTTAGAGGATPTGTWGVNTYWSPSAAGDAATGAWNAGYLGVFAAGTDATGGYEVTVSGTQDIGGLTVGEGNVTLSGDELQMTSDALASVAASSTLTVGSIISNDATPRQLAKGGSGTLILSGANTYTGSTNVGSGTLSIPTIADAGSDSPLGNFASLGAAGLTLAGGTLQYTGSTATTNRGFTLVADSTVGVSAAGTVLTLGASSGGGTLTVTGGSGSRLSLGPVTLVATNLTLNPTTGSLTVASVTGWPAVINGATAPTLVLGGSASGNSLTGIYSGVGPLTKSGSGDWKLNGASTYTGNTTVNTGNLIAGTNALNNAAGAFGQQNGVEIALGVANGNTAAGILTGGAFTVGRPIRLATNNATDTGTRVLTLGGNTAHNSTFSAAIHLGTASQTSKGITLTAATSGQVTFSGVIQNPTGQDAAETAAAAALTAVTKVGPGTVVLTNTNTYTGATRVSDGTLSVTGSLGATAVSVNAGTLSGNGNFGGNVTIASGATHSLAVAATTAAQDTSAITGTLAMAGSILNLTAAATPAPGEYVLATATVGITGTPATINTNGISGTVSVDTASSPKRLLLTVTVGSPFETWAGSGVAFDADANNDGVDNGMAWVLGAANPSENALNKLPAASRNGTGLRLTFRCLKSTKRGGAVLKVQSSSDLGLTDPWTNHEAAVPDADATVNGVVFDTTADGDYINVIADIPASGAKLFGRLSAVNAP